MHPATVGTQQASIKALNGGSVRMPSSTAVQPVMPLEILWLGVDLDQFAAAVIAKIEPYVGHEDELRVCPTPIARLAQAGSALLAASFAPITMRERSGV